MCVLSSPRGVYSLDSLVGQGARARDDANLALGEDLAGHDAELAGVGKKSGAVTADHARLGLGQKRLVDLELVALGDTLGDGDDEGDLGLDGLEDGVGGASGGNVDDRRLGLLGAHSVRDRAEDGEAEVGLARLLWGRERGPRGSWHEGAATCLGVGAANDLGAELDRLLGVEGALDSENVSACPVGSPEDITPAGCWLAGARTPRRGNTTHRLAGEALDEDLGVLVLDSGQRSCSYRYLTARSLLTDVDVLDRVGVGRARRRGGEGARRAWRGCQRGQFARVLRCLLRQEYARATEATDVRSMVVGMGVEGGEERGVVSVFRKTSVEEDVKDGRGRARQASEPVCKAVSSDQVCRVPWLTAPWSVTADGRTQAAGGRGRAA